MGKYTITQAQYQQVVGSNPSIFPGKDNPVEMISWVTAMEFCKKASNLSKRTIRLPTEAEWEFACRAGSNSNYSSGDDEAALQQAGWYNYNGQETTHPVGQKAPNKFNLYDMHGNVIQWCADWYSDSYYKTSPSADPSGPAGGAVRILRGGSWLRGPMDCRSAFRAFLPPHRFSYGTGFRIVVDLEKRVDK